MEAGYSGSVMLGLLLLGCFGSPPEKKEMGARRRERLERLASDEEQIPGRFKSITETPEEDLEALAALGYLDGTMPPPNDAGVRILDAAKVQPGANLYVSGQGPEAHLIDRDGNVLHKWAFDWFEAFPETDLKVHKEFPNHWRRAHLYENGDLLVVWGGQGMAKIDKDSRFLWGIDDENIHHDLDVAPDGSIWTLSREPMDLPELSDKPVVMDTVLVLEPDGTVREKFSVFDCFLNSKHRRWIPFMAKTGDVLHTNTITILPAGFSKPEFKEGNLLVSFRHTHRIATIDPKNRSVEWLLHGTWVGQHQPVLLDDDTVLLFDNRGLSDRSRVLEANTRTGRISWEYGGGDGEYFWSRILGSVQRLDNGNTLVSESDNGRAFEVTREGKRVWEFTNPFRAGDEDQYIASLYELVRLPEGFDLSWADASTATKSIRSKGRRAE